MLLLLWPRDQRTKLGQADKKKASVKKDNREIVLARIAVKWLKDAASMFNRKDRRNCPAG